MTAAEPERTAWVVMAIAGLLLGGLAAHLVAASAAPVVTALLLGLLAAVIWAEVGR